MTGCRTESYGSGYRLGVGSTKSPVGSLWRISWLAEELLLSLDRLCSMECTNVYSTMLIQPYYSLSEFSSVQTHTYTYFFSINVHDKNKDSFSTNYQIHNVHTRFKTDLHPPIANLTKFQKGVFYSGIKIFNNLPHNTKDLANETKLFWFLLINSFYNSKEYFNYQR
jgi:hypothetical protein